MNTVKIKILNQSMKKLHGEVVEVKADKHGSPVDRYWRNRIRDAERDGCVEVAKPKAKKPKPEAKPKEETTEESEQ